MEAQIQKKSKLTIDEQIVDMQNKKIKFEICSVEEAKKFLKYNNYYFKLKSYARNYNYDDKKEIYYNLDFAYIVELSKLDMYLRKIILELCLDVEHYLKVRLMNDLTNNNSEDGYNIVKLFLQYYPNARDDIQRKAGKYSFCSDLAENHLDEFKEIKDLAVWNCVELLSFGNFIDLYNVYYQTYDSFNYSPYLNSIKFIRNAAAHNNCILSSIRKPNSTKKFKKTKQLATIMNNDPQLRKIENLSGMMKNPIIHDFVTLLLVYNDIMKLSATKKIRDKKMENIAYQICNGDGRFRQNSNYFEKNPYLTNAYKFICNIIEYINRKNKNPKHTNFL